MKGKALTLLRKEETKNLHVALARIASRVTVMIRKMVVTITKTRARAVMRDAVAGAPEGSIDAFSVDEMTTGRGLEVILRAVRVGLMEKQVE